MDTKYIVVVNGIELPKWAVRQKLLFPRDQEILVRGGIEVAQIPLWSHAFAKFLLGGSVGLSVSESPGGYGHAFLEEHVLEIVNGCPKYPIRKNMYLCPSCDTLTGTPVKIVRLEGLKMWRFKCKQCCTQYLY